MKTIRPYKAQPIYKRQPIESVEINISEEFPDYGGLAELSDYAEIYRIQARELCETLYNALPGGTFDQLLCAMLTKKATLFKVPLGDPPAPESDEYFIVPVKDIQQFVLTRKGLVKLTQRLGE